MRRQSPRSAHIRNKVCGESELNIARYKTMGQDKFKDRELYVQALKAMLRIRGSRVRSV
jgi:hypothetical protein